MKGEKEFSDDLPISVSRLKGPELSSGASGVYFDFFLNDNKCDDDIAIDNETSHRSRIP